MFDVICCRLDKDQFARKVAHEDFGLKGRVKGYFDMESEFVNL
jgi:hypothetical protein